MKLYHKQKRLSSETKELVWGAVLAVLFVIDLRALPCFIGLILGIDMTAEKTVFGWIFVAQIALFLLYTAIGAYKAIRAIRAPKKLGVLTPQDICRIMEARK